MQDRDREILRKMRRSLGLRQAWLAKQTGIYRTKLSEWERGRVELTADELQRVGDAIGAIVGERANIGTLPSPEAAPSQSSVERGRTVADARRSWGITQAELARTAEMAEDVISLFENGYTELDPSELARVTKALTALINKKRAKVGRLVPLKSLLRPLPVEQAPAQKEEAHDARGVLLKANADLKRQVADLQGIREIQAKQIANLETQCLNLEEIATLRHAQIEGLKRKLSSLGVTPEEVADLLEDPELVTERTGGD